MTNEEKDSILNNLNKIQELLSAMETCHICGGILSLDEGATHCEDCSWDCDEHDEPECKPMWFYHDVASLAVKSIRKTIEE